jgi:hypothetical protein
MCNLYDVNQLPSFLECSELLKIYIKSLPSFTIRKYDLMNFKKLPNLIFESKNY